MMMSGIASRVRIAGGALHKPRETFADDRPHAAHDERGISDAKGHATGANHAGTGNRSIAHARPGLFRLEALGVGLLISKA
jgi:hypothetical protein